jgi:hypothetical protein
MDLLDRIPERLGRNIMRGALRAGAKVSRRGSKGPGRLSEDRQADQGQLEGQRNGDQLEGVGARGERHDRLRRLVPGIWRGSALDQAEQEREASSSRRMWSGARFITRASAPIRSCGPRWIPGPPRPINVMGEYIGARLNWDALRAPALAVEEDEE